MKKEKNIVTKCFLALVSPIHRARALHRDDRAQVMVLTAVMAFVLSILAITTLNTTTMLYNRIRTQNAVDAAADAYALWQARGSNMAQSLNDMHYNSNKAATIAAYTTCGIRIAGGVACVLQFAPIIGLGLKGVCEATCGGTSAILSTIEVTQALLSTIILGTQTGLNYIFPLIGFDAANSIAEANGASPVLTGLGDFIESLLAAFGVTVDITSVLAAIPGADLIFVLPLTPSSAFTLNLEKKDNSSALPAPWSMNSTFMDSCNNIPCILASAGRTFTCMQSPLADESDDCGWKDTFFTGFPGYTTWVAGKQSQNILGGLTNHKWLNPRSNEDPDVVVNYVNHDQFAFNYGTTPGAGTTFENPGFVALASSQAFGHEDESKQPVVEKSDVGGFQWMKPQLISVHVGDPPSDTVMESMLIWH